ncbi:MAG: hypothetical protein ACPG4Z_01785 [Chitinophagales bacterium]
MKIHFCFLFILVYGSIFCQKVDKNTNEFYIQKQFDKIDDFVEKAKYIEGEVYAGGDTIDLDLIKFKKVNRQNYHLFCIGKINDSIVYYTASEIDGYRIGSDFYKTHVSDSIYFFIKQVQYGKVNLYERVGVPSDAHFAYYFEFKDKEHYYVMYPDLTLYEQQDLYGKNGVLVKTLYTNTGVELRFQWFVSSYFSDCIKVPNMVKSGFYTIDDISSIVSAYNKCFEEE